VKISSDEIRYLSPMEMQSYGLTGEDPAWAEYKRASQIETMGEKDIEKRKPSSPL